MLWYKCLMKKMSCLNWSCPRLATYPDSSSVHSWKSCWRCSAPTRAAGKWWFVILWTDAYFPWILHVEFDAGRQWRPTEAFWVCSLYPSRALVLSSCTLQERGGQLDRAGRGGCGNTVQEKLGEKDCSCHLPNLERMWDIKISYSL